MTFDRWRIGMFFSLWFRLCLVKSEDWTNYMSQMEHWNGFCLLWLRLCLVKLEDMANNFSQMEH